MPKAIHDRAMRLLPEMKKTYPPKKAKQVAFAVATQQAYATGEAPKKWHGKTFGTPEGKREAKRKFDKPKSEYESLKESSAHDLAEFLRSKQAFNDTGMSSLPLKPFTPTISPPAEAVPPPSMTSSPKPIPPNPAQPPKLPSTQLPSKTPKPSGVTTTTRTASVDPVYLTRAERLVVEKLEAKTAQLAAEGKTESGTVTTMTHPSRMTKHAEMLLEIVKKGEEEKSFTRRHPLGMMQARLLEHEKEFGNNRKHASTADILRKKQATFAVTDSPSAVPPGPTGYAGPAVVARRDEVAVPTAPMEDVYGGVPMEDVYGGASVV